MEGGGGGGGSASHQQDIVVDGLGDPDNAADHAGLVALLLDDGCASVSAIAAHHKHKVDRQQVNALHDLPATRAV